jgi:hypothetical protein
MMEAVWHDRSEAPRAGQKIWVTDGKDMWLLTADGNPFPDSATACRLWTPAIMPDLPDRRTAAKVKD